MRHLSIFSNATLSFVYGGVGRLGHRFHPCPPLQAQHKVSTHRSQQLSRSSTNTHWPARLGLIWWLRLVRFLANDHTHFSPSGAKTGRVPSSLSAGRGPGRHNSRIIGLRDAELIVLSTFFLSTHLVVPLVVPQVTKRHTRMNKKKSWHGFNVDTGHVSEATRSEQCTKPPLPTVRCSGICKSALGVGTSRNEKLTRLWRL